MAFAILQYDCEELNSQISEMIGEREDIDWYTYEYLLDYELDKELMRQEYDMVFCIENELDLAVGKEKLLQFEV